MDRKEIPRRYDILMTQAFFYHNRNIHNFVINSYYIQLSSISIHDNWQPDGDWWGWTIAFRLSSFEIEIWDDRLFFEINCCISTK